MEKHPENGTSNNNTLTKDQLWFDTWEGQIELSSQDLSPKKHNSAISDLLLEDEVDQFDEFADLSTFEQKHSSSSALLRQTSLPAAIFSSRFDNNFHSAHTLFWNHHHDSSSEDVSQIRELQKYKVIFNHKMTGLWRHPLMMS